MWKPQPNRNPNNIFPNCWEQVLWENILHMKQERATDTSHLENMNFSNAWPQSMQDSFSSFCFIYFVEREGTEGEEREFRSKKMQVKNKKWPK